MGEPAAARERLSPGAARLLLAIAYFALAALYAWQASKRVSPTIFSDEIEFAQISRGIAEDGIPSRRGEPSGFGSLYTFLVAPAWCLEKGALLRAIDDELARRDSWQGKQFTSAETVGPVPGG